MTYNDGEALILTQVQACSNFDSTNTSRAKYAILNQGKDDHYAILRPGGWTLQWVTPCVYHVTWSTVIEVWQRYVDDGTTHTNLYARIADLFPIQTVPKLGDTTGTILDSTFAGDDEPQEMWRGKGDGPSWLRWKLTCYWLEETNIS